MVLLHNLESLLIAHDWGYEYSDDHRVWRRGEDQYKAIKAMMAEAEALGYQQEAIDLFKRYVPAYL